MDKLKPCPFCGAPAEIVNIEEGENAGGSCVCCTRCQASSNVEFGFKENFVSNWNTRATSGTVAVEPDHKAMAGRLAEAMQALVAHARGCEVLLKVPIQPATEIALEALAEFEASKLAALADKGE